MKITRTPSKKTNTTKNNVFGKPEGGGGPDSFLKNSLRKPILRGRGPPFEEVAFLLVYCFSSEVFDFYWFSLRFSIVLNKNYRFP